MLGFIGDSFLGERIFYVCKQSPKTIFSQLWSHNNISSPKSIIGMISPNDSKVSIDPSKTSSATIDQDKVQLVDKMSSGIA